MSPASDSRPSCLRAALAEVAVCLLFALLAVAYHCGATRGLSPNPLLGGDAGFIASWAAALDRPEAFAGDEVLADASNFAVYSSCHLHVPLVGWLAKWKGDYGSAFASMVGLHVFLQGIGFYVLGRVLLRGRFWAVLYSLLTLVPLTLGRDVEVWGAYPDPLPRISFQALLPFVLAAAIRFRDRQAMWVALLVAMGFLMYVHPASAPPCALAVWMGIWATLPAAWRWPKRIGMMFVLGLVFLAAASTSFVPYLAHHKHGAAVGAPYAEVMQAMRDQYEMVLSPLRALVSVLKSPSMRPYVWALAFLGACAMLHLRRDDRAEVSIVWRWTAGILLASVAIPWAEHAIEERLRWVPVELDLVRGLRYLVPLALLFVLWPLAELSRRSSRGVAALLAAVGVLMGAHWAGSARHRSEELLSAVRAWSQGRLYPELDEESRCVQEAMVAVRDRTPDEARLFVIPNRLAVRYFAFRPVVWCVKDGAILIYSNPPAAVEWERVYGEVKKVPREATQGRADGLVAIARKAGAEYLLMDALGKGVSPGDAEEVWSNRRYSLLHIPPK